MSAMLILAGVGIATSAISGFKAAEAEREAAEMNALFKEEKANELIRRTTFNNSLISRESERVQGIQTVQSAASGLDVSSGVSLALLEETASLAKEQIIVNSIEAEYDANTLRTEADYERANARQIERARKITAIGNSVSQIAGAYDANPGTIGNSGAGSYTPPKFDSTLKKPSLLTSSGGGRLGDSAYNNTSLFKGKY